MAEARSDSLKYQWRVVGLVVRSSWATSLDKSVAFEIVDNYRKDFGNSRASLSYLQTATGADRKSVIASTRRFVEHGPFRVIRQGAGTRPTEYDILFDMVSESASSGAPTTTTEISSSSGVDATPCSGVDATTSGPSSGVDTTESVLPVNGLQAGLQDRMNNNCAPPTAPPGSASDGPTGAEVRKRESKQPFDELWLAYGHRQKRVDARAAYDAAAPDEDLHQTMVDAATAWQAHWSRQNNPHAPRKSLASWIRSEGYLEDPPAGFVPKERKAKPKAANDSVSPRPVTRNTSGPVVGQVVQGDVIKTPDSTHVQLVICNAAGGQEWTRRIALESRDSNEQYDGQREFANLCTALDLSGVNDTSELLFKPFLIKSGAGAESGPIEYAAYSPEDVQVAA